MGPVEYRGLVQCLGLLCVPRLLPPFGFGSVTVFDLVLPRASPSQRPACGTTTQASSYSPSPSRDEGHQVRGSWERVPRFIAQKPCPGETASLAPATVPCLCGMNADLEPAVPGCANSRLWPSRASC